MPPPGFTYFHEKIVFLYFRSSLPKKEKCLKENPLITSEAQKIMLYKKIRKEF